MHIDAKQLPNNSLIEGDICIIGAGAAGISIALEWLNTPYKVILLEGGGFEYDTNMQQLYNGTKSGQDFPSFAGSRLHYFGGTTGHWAGFCSPFDPIDFKKRSWIPNSGWPFSKEDLDPFYERAQKTIQLGPYNYDLEFWQKELPNMLSLPLNDKVIKNKIWQYNQARFGNMYKEQLVNAKNVHLYTYANATELQTNDVVTEVTKIIIKNHAGKTHSVKAKHIILACGAIQNTRLLLASNSKAKAGLGNNNDLVGRYLMEHIEVPVADIEMVKPFPTNLYSFEFGVTKASAELSIAPEVQEQEQILNGTSSFHLNDIPNFDSEKALTWQGISKAEKHLKNASNDWHITQENATRDNITLGKSFQMNIRMEQAPNPNSRITLGNEKDKFGVPRTHVNWDLTYLDKRSIRTIHYLIGKEMALSGLGRLKFKPHFEDANDTSWPDDTHGGNHHMGTTRMDSDPKKGVVNTDCKIHGISNLFVAGSACFPTAGAPNPTLTLTALSIKLSDHIKKII